MAFQAPGTLTHSLSPLPPQTELPILLGPAVCQCLGDKRELRLLGMGQTQAEMGGRSTQASLQKGRLPAEQPRDGISIPA